MNDLESIWHLVCTYFQAKTTEMSYRSWITTAKPLQFTDNTLLLEVPSVAHRDYWSKNLTDQADAFLEKTLGEQITVLLKLPDEPNPFTIAAVFRCTGFFSQTDFSKRFRIPIE